MFSLKNSSVTTRLHSLLQMNFGSQTKVNKFRRSIVSKDHPENFPSYLQHNLQFYNDVPLDKISLNEVGTLAVERQKGCTLWEALE